MKPPRVLAVPAVLALGSIGACGSHAPSPIGAGGSTRDGGAAVDARGVPPDGHGLDAASAMDAAGPTSDGGAAADAGGSTPDAEVPCIPSGDQNDIMAALTGPGAEAVLCPSAIFDLTGPVEYTAEDQSIHTRGLPGGDTRATLRIVAPDLAVAVDGMWLDRVELRNVIVDGQRPTLGMLPDDGALLNFGYNSAGQLIEGVLATNPRGWVAIYVNEGADPLCDGAVVRDNVVHTAGTLYSRVDGISIGCSNSLVENNTIIDATDGAIVIFQAPGSIIRNNVIRAETISLTYGISMIDNFLFEGDFGGTEVLDNTIDAAGAVIRTGIPMGDAPGCPSDIRVRNAEVRGNVLKGGHMGYGFPIMGVEDWIAVDNVDLSTHEPVRAEAFSCLDEPQPAAAGFQIDRSRASGTFQPEYEDAALGLLLEAYPEPIVFSEECLAGVLGGVVLQEIKEGARGQVAFALEQAPGGSMLEQCVSALPIPPDSSDAYVLIRQKACEPTCVTLELENTGTAAVDTTDAAFLLESFLVDCVGLPPSIPGGATVACRIDDFVAEGSELLIVYGLRALPRVSFVDYPFTM